MHKMQKTPKNNRKALLLFYGVQQCGQSLRGFVVVSFFEEQCSLFCFSKQKEIIFCLNLFTCFGGDHFTFLANYTKSIGHLHLV